MMKIYAEQLADLKALEAAGTMPSFSQQVADAEALRISEGRPFATLDGKYVIYSTDAEMNDAKARTLATRISELKANVSAKYYGVEVAGINFTYRTIQVPVSTSRDSQAAIDSARNMVRDNEWVDNSPFLFADGVFRPVTSAEIVAICTAVRSHVKACRSVEADKFQEINATGTTDVNAGWPATAGLTVSPYFQGK